MADETLLRQLAANWRINTLRVLRTLSSPSEQRAYMAAVPFVHVTVELFCQWDSMYQPSVAAFELAFAPSERPALTAFDLALRRALVALPDPLPDMEEFIASAVGTELTRAAIATLRSLGETEDG